MTIAVDFDGVIRSWTTNEPLPGARDALSRLREAGHRILIHSCNDRHFIADWLLNHDIRHDGIWANPGKPVADLYVDDRGYQFTNWESLLASLPDLDKPE